MYQKSDSEKKCRKCRWCSRSYNGYECRFFDVNRERAQDDRTAERCCFYDDITKAHQVGQICDAIYSLADLIAEMKEGGRL